MLADLLADLEAEQAALDLVLSGLNPSAWDVQTPAEGWTVRDQVSHLAFSEELAALAATDPTRFGERLAELLADIERADVEPRERGRAMQTDALLEWWRETRAATAGALRDREDKDRIPWVTGEMSAVSFTTARLMETWAHGQDVVDATGMARPATNRLRHICHLGVATRGFSYQVHGLPVPATSVRVDLLAPNGDTWSWGPEDAADRVSGSAEEFCLVVTQRRNVADTELRASGPSGAEWLSIAQAFAGPPGRGRAPQEGVA